MSDKILNAFGSFLVDLGEEQPAMFKTEAEAVAALSEYENGAAQREEAADFCAFAHPGLADKALKGKSNVIVAYMQWVDAGRPEPVVAEEETDEEG